MNFRVWVFGFHISMAVMTALVLSSTADADANANGNARRQQIRAFDGEGAKCEGRLDLGRLAYRISDYQGVVVDEQLEITVDFQTLKCVEGVAGFGFKEADLRGRLFNPFIGLVEFSNLELVAYNTDFTIVKVQPVALDATEHRVKFVAAIGSFPGMRLRSASDAEGPSAKLIVFLRGTAEVTEPRTRRVQTARRIPFGAVNLFMSERYNNLVVVRQD